MAALARFCLCPAAQSWTAAPARRFIGNIPGVIDCSSVVAKRDAYGGAGAFAGRAFKKGEVIERGLVRVLPVCGHKSEYVFTWKKGEETVYATGSGTSVLYNASLDGSENTSVERFYDEQRFNIVATKDIEKDEELTHLYHGIDWRECFKPLGEEREKILANGGRAPVKDIPDPTEDLVECSAVYVKDHPEYEGVGAYASRDIKEGELIEKGLMRRLPISAHDSSMLFTWAKDGSAVASGTGCAIFYNAGLKDTANVSFTRFFDEDRFEVYAKRDIKKDEELTHLYMGLEWRKCFADLNAIHEA